MTSITMREGRSSDVAKIGVTGVSALASYKISLLNRPLDGNSCKNFLCRCFLFVQYLNWNFIIYVHFPRIAD